MKRRPDQEREETTAREQAETRRDALLADLKAREAAGRAPEPPAEAAAAAGEIEPPPPDAEPAADDQEAEPDASTESA